jgi:hypothetical protein
MQNTLEGTEKDIKKCRARIEIKYQKEEKRIVISKSQFSVTLYGIQ